MSKSVERSLSSITVESDCERYLHIIRYEADAVNVVYKFSGNADYLKRRLELLDTILGAQLNPTAFRNVIRQAEYDSAATELTLADEETRSGGISEGPRVRRNKALQLFKQFVQGFDSEIDAAKREGKCTTDVLEGSDFPSYVIGAMQVATVAIKQREVQIATEYLNRCLLLLQTVPDALTMYPELEEHKRQCKEMIELLGHDGNPRGSGSTPTAPAHVMLPKSVEMSHARVKAVRLVRR